MKFQTKKIIAVIMFMGFSFAVLVGMNDFVFASGATGTLGDNSYVPLAPLPGTTNSGGSVNLNTYIPGVFNLAIGIAGVLAVLMIVIGGVEYMTTDAIQGKTEGKTRIQNALWGLLLALVSWVMLHTINPNLTVFDLNVKTITIIPNDNGPRTITPTTTGTNDNRQQTTTSGGGTQTQTTTGVDNNQVQTTTSGGGTQTRTTTNN